MIVAFYDPASGSPVQPLLKTIVQVSTHSPYGGPIIDSRPWIEIDAHDTDLCTTHGVDTGVTPPVLAERDATDPVRAGPPQEPAYRVLRRAAYPPQGDQLDAFWKGPDSPEFKAMQAAVAAVKAKYPKPA